MPTSGVVLRPCAHARCGELVEHGRCAKHRPVADQQRGTSTQRGYDPAFRVLRPRCFVRDGWTCVDCGWQPDIVREFASLGLPLPRTEVVLEELRERWRRNDTHLHADHQIPVDERPDLRLSLDNLRTRCDRCHAKKTRAEHTHG